MYKMTVLSSILLYTFVFLTVCITVNYAQSLVGRVYVGQSTNDDTDLYTFNENFLYDLHVPVYITIEDDTGNEQTPPVPLNIDVSCELTTFGLDGYSKASFVTLIDVVVGTDNIGTVTNVSFTGMVPGRATDMQCWGESSNNTVPLFSKQSSIANTKSFEVRPAGIVSTCSEVVKVSTGGGSGSLLLELSEPVEIGNVTVNCADTTTPGSIQVTFQAVSINTGQRVEIPYSVAAGGGNSVTVNCFAATIPDSTSDNIQFYQQNSTGNSSEFTEDTGTVKFVPLVTQLRTTELTAFLILDSPVSVNTEFACRLEVTNDTASAVIIVENTKCLPLDGSTPVVGTTEISFSTDAVVTTQISMNTTDFSGTTERAPTVNLTDGWNLVNPSIIFTPGTYFKRVQITRQGQDKYAQTLRPEVVVVHCCAPEGINTNQKYINQSAAFAAVAYLSPNVSTAWDNATDPANQNVETEVLEPHYVEVSPCPCDITNKSCDVNCCCDTYCSADDINTFECVPGIKGGAQYDEIPEYNCTAEYFNKPDWFPIMCVQFENSAFLGYFRPPEAAIRNSQDFQSKLDQFDPKFSFQQEVVPQPLEVDGDSTGYKDGLIVKTGLPTTQPSPALDIGPNYRLVLPGRSLSGECVFSDPVRFTKESSDTCIWKMKESICSTTSPLNALNYALSTKGLEPICRKGLLLVKEQEVAEVGITNVDYHCTGSDLAPYLRTNDTKRDRLPNDEVKLFDDELPNEGDDCAFDSNTGAYVCSPIIPSTPTSSLPPRCSWDNGYTKAPTPELDNSTDITVCRNAVVEVRYNFTWSGPQVILLNATVVLGDIPLLQEKFETITVTYQDGNDTRTMTETSVNNYTTALTQLLNVEWHHGVNETFRSNTSSTSEVYQRSGVIGYDLNLPVYSGISILNETDDTLQYIDTNTSSTLALWKAGPDSLCDSASREPIKFRQNGMGSCLLRLGLEQLKNCTYLRKLVLNQQDELMMSNYIAQGGDPNTEILTDWLNIYRQDLSAIIGGNITQNETMSTEMPMTTDMLSNSTDDNLSGTYNYLDDIIGVCTNIPSHINVDILYAEVGKNNDLPFYQIIGAKINYVLSSWSLYCTAADGAKCYGDTQWLENIAKNTAYVQSFVVSSSVNFIQVPGNVPERKSKRAVSESSNYYTCHQDACWTEAFYPLTQGFRGADFQYTLSFTLVSVVFLLGFFFITRPWW